MSISNINGLSGNNTVRGDAGKPSQARGDSAASTSERSPVVSTSDSLSLSDGAARLRSLEAAVASAPEVDIERISALKQAIADGSYQVNVGKLADKLIQLESAFAG